MLPGMLQPDKVCTLTEHHPIALLAGDGHDTIFDLIGPRSRAPHSIWMLVCRTRLCNDIWPGPQMQDWS